jgi:hypothetical protein
MTHFGENFGLENYGASADVAIITRLVPIHPTAHA